MLEGSNQKFRQHDVGARPEAKQIDAVNDRNIRAGEDGGLAEVRHAVDVAQEDVVAAAHAFDNQARHHFQIIDRSDERR